jgi:hypothetical protein
MGKRERAPMTNESRTINATNMPEGYLKAYLEGQISFDEAYHDYPGPDVTINEIPETTPDMEQE